MAIWLSTVCREMLSSAAIAFCFFPQSCSSQRSPGTSQAAFQSLSYDRLDVRFRKDLIIKCLQRLQFHLQLDVVIISHLLCAFSDYRFVPQQIEASVLRSGKQPGEQAGVRHQHKLLFHNSRNTSCDVLRVFFTNEVFEWRSASF